GGVHLLQILHGPIELQFVLLLVGDDVGRLFDQSAMLVLGVRDGLLQLDLRVRAGLELAVCFGREVPPPLSQYIHHSHGRMLRPGRTGRWPTWPDPTLANGGPDQTVANGGPDLRVANRPDPGRMVGRGDYGSGLGGGDEGWPGAGEAGCAFRGAG